MDICFFFSPGIGSGVLREPRESTTLAWREREDVGFSLFLFGFSPQGYLNGSFSILTKVTENPLYNLPRGY